MTWTLANAKNQLSEVVRRALDQGPQTISVRGQDRAVVISVVEFEALRSPNRPKDFKDFLLSIPSLEGVDLTRDPSLPREVDL